MSDFAKMLYLAGRFTDLPSRLLLAFEWLVDRDSLDFRFRMETRMEAMNVERKYRRDMPVLS